MKKIGIIWLMVVFFLAGCSFPQAQVTPTVDIDATVRAKAATVFAQYTETSAAASPVPSQTPTQPPPTLTPSITPTSAPIPAPVAAVAGNNVTVRAEPRKGSQNIGGIFYNQPIKVIARNDGANWYYVEYPKVPAGAAWVLAAAVDMKGNDPAQLPIAILDENKTVKILPPMVWVIEGAPLGLNVPPAGAQTAIAKELIKVRIGPSVGYTTMGTLNPGATVTVTGRTVENDWYQIEYPSGPGARGWVSARLFELKGALAGLPFYNLLATPAADPDQVVDPPTPDPNAVAEPTTAPEATPTLPPAPAGLTGEATASDLNVRSGPASRFPSLGTLNRGDAVIVTGQTINGFWYRIVYPAAPDGYGYVSPKYIKITGGDMTKMEYLNDTGTPIAKP